MSTLEDNDKKPLAQTNSASVSPSSQTPSEGAGPSGKKLKTPSVSDSTAVGTGDLGVSMETTDPVVNEEQEVERRKLQ